MNVSTDRAYGLDRYRLERPLTDFDSHEVWLAADTRLRRQVTITAIPVKPPAGQSAEAARAQIVGRLKGAAQLTSNSIAATYDIVETPDDVLVVNEFINTATLRQRVHEGGPFAPEQVRSLAKYLLAGLTEAHARQLVHGALTPSKVFVFDDGLAKVTGFGWAPLVSSDHRGETSDRYLAPELIAGSSVGPAVDSWGLGAIMHFALYGTSPRAIRLGEARPVSSSPQMERLIAELLIDDPEGRPALDSLPSRLDAVRRRRPYSASRITSATTETPVTNNDRTSTEVPLERTSPGRRVLLAMAALAVVLLAGVAIAAQGRGGEDDARAPVSVVESMSDATSPNTTTSTTGRAPTTSIVAPSSAPVAVSPVTTSSSSPPGVSTIPEGWLLYVDQATGYRIARPPGWTIRPMTSFRTDFVDPSSSAFVRVEWTDAPGPDPLEAWRSQASTFSAHQQGYQELRLERTDFKGHRAAEWEFRYLDKGVLRHAIDIGMVTGRYGAAVFAVGPETVWPDVESHLGGFLASFQPPV